MRGVQFIKYFIIWLFSFKSIKIHLKQFNIQNWIIIYQYFLKYKLLRRIMYYSHPIFTPPSTPTLYYCPSPIFIYLLPQNYDPTVDNLMPNIDYLQDNQLERTQYYGGLQKPVDIIKQKGETCESFLQLETKPKSNRKAERKSSTSSYSIPDVKWKEVKLSYRIEWRNQNRNIVPNLINQMISFLLKQSKSMKLSHRLFDRLPHPKQCTLPKYFQYVKKIKQSITHYVNESVFLHFFEIHQPHCQLYTLQEQQFYMKICRIVMLSFMRNQIKLISLTSKRMSQAKRKMHLIARQALESKFLQLCKAGSK